VHIQTVYPHPDPHSAYLSLRDCQQTASAVGKEGAELHLIASRAAIHAHTRALQHCGEERECVCGKAEGKHAGHACPEVQPLTHTLTLHTYKHTYTYTHTHAHTKAPQFRDVLKQGREEKVKLHPS